MLDPEERLGDPTCAGQSPRTTATPVALAATVLPLFATAAAVAVEIADGTAEERTSMTSTTTTSTTTTLTRTVTVIVSGQRPTPSAQHGSYSLQGCFSWPGADTALGADFAMPLSATALNDITPALCLDACARARTSAGKPFEIVALGEGRDCFCGTNLSAQAHSVGIGNCSTPCAGDGRTTCGGSEHTVVYALIGNNTNEGAGTVGNDSGTIAEIDFASLPPPAPAAAVVLGSLAGFAIFLAIAFLGWRLYARRRGLSTEPFAPPTPIEGIQKEDVVGVVGGGKGRRHGGKDRDDVVLADAPAPVMGMTRGRTAGEKDGSSDALSSPFSLVTTHTIDNYAEGRRFIPSTEAAAVREGTMRVQFHTNALLVHTAPATAAATSSSSSTMAWQIGLGYHKSPAAGGQRPRPQHEGTLRHRRASSTKPVDWARFDMADGLVSPTSGSPTHESFHPHHSRRTSLTAAPRSSPLATATVPMAFDCPMAATTATINHLPAPDSHRPSAVKVRDGSWLASPSSSVPTSAASTVGTSILDVSPTTLQQRPSVQEQEQQQQLVADSPTIPPSVAAGPGLGDRALRRRRLGVPLPPAAAFAAGGNEERRSSIAGDYDGVRLGRVGDEEGTGIIRSLVPEPLRVVKAAAVGASFTVAAGGEEDESPVLPIW